MQFVENEVSDKSCMKFGLAFKWKSTGSIQYQYKYYDIKQIE